MEDVDNLVKVVNAKLGVLELTRKLIEASLDNDAILDNSREIERKLRSREEKKDEVNELILKVQELKLLAGEDVGEVESWGNEIVEKVTFQDQTDRKIQLALQPDRKQAEEVIRKSKFEEEEMRLERAIEEKKRIERAKQEIRVEYGETSASSSVNKEVNLPRLSISKFEGKPTDFLRFWSMFIESVDKTSLPTTSKFSHLLELVGSKVRILIEALPFTREVYTRAKTILENKYGRSSEIVTAHIQNIMNLRTIQGGNPVRINEFYEVLVRNVQAFETMGPLESVNGYTMLLLDRLPGIRSELVRDDDYWQDWKFPELVESLRRWTERNPAADSRSDRFQRHEGHKWIPNRERVYRTGDQNVQMGGASCVYCNSKAHKSVQCNVLSQARDRKKFLAERKFCFNCTGSQHQAGRCKSTRNCAKCNARHHTSICEKSEENPAAGQVRQSYSSHSSQSRGSVPHNQKFNRC